MGVSCLVVAEFPNRQFRYKMNITGFELEFD